MPRTRFVTLPQAAALIPDGATVAVNSSSGLLCPDALLRAVGERFEQSGHPQGLTTIHPIAAGDMYGIDGVEHIARPGLLARVIAGSLPSGPSSMETPAIWRMIDENRIDAYNIPSGLIFHQLREAAAKRPGVPHAGRHRHLPRPAAAGGAHERAHAGRDGGAGRVRRPGVALPALVASRRGPAAGVDRGRAGQPLFRARGRLPGRIRCRAGRAQQRRRGHRAGDAARRGRQPAGAVSTRAGRARGRGRGRARRQADDPRPTTTRPSAARCGCRPRISSWPSGGCRR